MRLRPWQLSALLVALCAAAVVLAIRYRTQRLDTTAELLRHLPLSESVLLAIDVKALRAAGLLEMVAGSRTAEELEYRKFVNDAGFDYREDLDSILVAFSQGDVHCLLLKRFDWALLRTYVEARGGNCLNGFCRLEGSRAGRRISFFALRPNVLALTVSDRGETAWILSEPNRGQRVPEVPDRPLWLSVTAGALGRLTVVPRGMESHLRALRGAEEITVAFDSSRDAFQAELRIQCRTGQEAAEMLRELQQATERLRELLARANRAPNPADLTGVLLAGEFKKVDRNVYGRWPVSWDFLRSVAEGKL